MTKDMQIFLVLLLSIIIALQIIGLFLNAEQLNQPRHVGMLPKASEQIVGTVTKRANLKVGEYCVNVERL